MDLTPHSPLGRRLSVSTASRLAQLTTCSWLRAHTNLCLSASMGVRREPGSVNYSATNRDRAQVIIKQLQIEGLAGQTLLEEAITFLIYAGIRVVLCIRHPEYHAK